MDPACSVIETRRILTPQGHRPTVRRSKGGTCSAGGEKDSPESRLKSGCLVRYPPVATRADKGAVLKGRIGVANSGSFAGSDVVLAQTNLSAQISR